MRHLERALRAVYGQEVTLDAGRMAAADDEGQADLLVDAIAQAKNVPAAILRSQRDFHLDALAVKRHRPRTYAGPVTLFRATQEPPSGAAYLWFDRADPTLGWDRFCTGRLDVRPLDGHHFALLDPPYVQVIAEHLRNVLSAG